MISTIQCIKREENIGLTRVSCISNTIKQQQQQKQKQIKQANVNKGKTVLKKEATGVHT